MNIDTLKTIFDKINSYIKPGDLPGNGFDQTAERNGLILALNIIAEEINKLEQRK